MEPEYARRLIERRLGDLKLLIERLRSADASAVVLDQTSVGRLSRMDALQQVAMSTGYQTSLLRDRRRLGAALARLDGGTFGLCCKCANEVPQDRLELDLGAPFCAACQLDIEDTAERRIRPGS
jgi:DnaK suppressor protein